jgi:zinc and cadmium transporter
MLAFSAGALFGDTFIHLIPEIIEEQGSFNLFSAGFLLFGILMFFVIEKFIHWQHCHMPITKEHIHPFAYMNLVGDGFHNFIDGLIIAGSYLVDFKVGIATTLAVILHEIPQEIGDFGVLLHGGFSRGKALLLNFATALTAVLGTIAVLLVGSKVEGLSSILLPIAAGGFIYIAGADLIPELHKQSDLKVSVMSMLFFFLGIFFMFLFTLIHIH